MSASERLQHARAIIINHAEAISELFIDGARVTILVRNPDIGESGHLLVTPDSLDDIREAIDALEARGAKVDDPQ